MHTSLTSLLLLPLLAAASPVSPRAGGPIGTPIPANCTVINPLPHAHCGHANVHGYMPLANFSSANLVYSEYYTPTDSAAKAASFCFEQCHGFGYPGDCKAAVFAQNVPTPKGYYGSPGGSLTSACLFYGTYLDPLQFGKAPKGQYVNATAADIYCPS